MNKSLEERRLFILEAGCCGGDDMGDAPMDAGEEGTDVAPLTPLQGFLTKRKSKKKKNG